MRGGSSVRIGFTGSSSLCSCCFGATATRINFCRSRFWIWGIFFEFRTRRSSCLNSSGCFGSGFGSPRRRRGSGCRTRTSLTGSGRFCTTALWWIFTLCGRGSSWRGTSSSILTACFGIFCVPATRFALPRRFFRTFCLGGGGLGWGYKLCSGSSSGFLSRTTTFSFGRWFLVPFSRSLSCRGSLNLLTTL